MMIYIDGYACTIAVCATGAFDLFFKQEVEVPNEHCNRGYSEIISAGWSSQRFAAVWNTREEAEEALQKIRQDWWYGHSDCDDQALDCYSMSFLLNQPSVAHVSVLIPESEADLEELKEYHSFVVVKSWSPLGKGVASHTDVRGSSGSFPSKVITDFREALYLRDGKAKGRNVPYWTVVALVVFGSSGSDGQMELFDMEQDMSLVREE